MPELRLFSPSGVAGRDVVTRFIRKDAKRISGVREALYGALRVLELTPQMDLKRTGKLQSLRSEVHEFRADLPDHWIRFFVAYYPTGSQVVILHLVIKKTNQLDSDDIEQAIRNLKIFKNQLRRR